MVCRVVHIARPALHQRRVQPDEDLVRRLAVVGRVVEGFFFFASRRRHTRFDCDWSSDVCSSDLVAFHRDAWFGADGGEDAVDNAVILGVVLAAESDERFGSQLFQRDRFQPDEGMRSRHRYTQRVSAQQFKLDACGLPAIGLVVYFGPSSNITIRAEKLRPKHRKRKSWHSKAFRLGMTAGLVELEQTPSLNLVSFPQTRGKPSQKNR